MFPSALFILALSSPADAFVCDFTRNGECVSWSSSQDVDYKLNASALDDFNTVDVKAAIASAAAKWHNVSNSNSPKFVYDGTTSELDTEFDNNTIMFVDCTDWRYDDDWHSVTTVYLNDWNTAIVRFDIEVNACLPLVILTEDDVIDPNAEIAYDLETVMLQAWGRVYGLDMNLAIESSVMHPQIYPNEVSQKLTDDDKEGARALYPHGASAGCVTGSAPHYLFTLPLIALGLRRRRE